ncbi:MAG: sulfotransferase [Cyanobacteria bacterium P01_D01_bin.36]
MIYVILGMHKSGTTLISEILHSSGINMVEESISDYSYDTGVKYERESSRNINHSILQSRGVPSIEIETLKAYDASHEVIRNMRDIISACSKHHENWGFKDPRTCLTYPLWASQLPKHKIIIIYRSIEEVWQRYLIQKSKKSEDSVLDTTKKVFSTWTDYNTRILNIIRTSHSPYLVLDYAQFLKENRGFLQLEDFVGKTLKDKRKIELYRSKPQFSTALSLYKNLLYRKKISRINTKFKALKST